MKKQVKILVSVIAIIAVIAIGTSVAGMATDATAPAKVTGLNITTTTTSISMTWNAPDNGGSDITGYTVEIVANSTDTSMANATSTSFAHTAAQVGTFYEYRVRATNAVGDGPWSAQGGSSIIVLDPPLAPLLTVSSTTTSINLSWLEPNNGGSPITGYKVEYWEDGSSTATSTASTTGTSWSHTAATLGTTYVYRVLAINSVGEGAWSANTTGALVNPAATAPAKITKYSVSLNSDGKRALSWTAPGDGGSAITGYTIEYDDDAKKKYTALVCIIIQSTRHGSKCPRRGQVRRVERNEACSLARSPSRASFFAPVPRHRALAPRRASRRIMRQPQAATRADGFRRVPGGRGRRASFERSRLPCPGCGCRRPSWWRSL